MRFRQITLRPGELAAETLVVDGRRVRVRGGTCPPQPTGSVAKPWTPPISAPPVIAYVTAPATMRPIEVAGHDRCVAVEDPALADWLRRVARDPDLDLAMVELVPDATPRDPPAHQLLGAAPGQAPSAPGPSDEVVEVPPETRRRVQDLEGAAVWVVVSRCTSPKAAPPKEEPPKAPPTPRDGAALVSLRLHDEHVQLLDLPDVLADLRTRSDAGTTLLLGVVPHEAGGPSWRQVRTPSAVTTAVALDPEADDG